MQHRTRRERVTPHDATIMSSAEMSEPRFEQAVVRRGSYEPLRRSAGAAGCAPDWHGRRLPQHLKAQVCRELDRLELLLEQIKAVEAERDALLDTEQTKASAPPPMLLGVHGVGPEFASVLWSEGLSRRRCRAN
jgi:transposase